MSTTYKIKQGDTLDSIARRQYGSETHADLISDSNPGISETLTPGTTIVIPDNPDSSKSSSQGNILASYRNEVAILINGKRFRFWESVRITRSVDTISTVEFTAPFETDSFDFKETFKPFSFKPVTIYVGGELFFTGTMIGVNPVVESEKKHVSVSCYARPGVLNDCTPPASSFPLEFDGQDIKSIAEKLSRPFGIGVEFKSDFGAAFERVACNPGKKILSFLSGFAQQRNLVISNTTDGKLMFSKSVESGPIVARLAQGQSPVVSVAPTFDPQEYYSHITGIEPVVVGLAGSQFTVKNPRLSGVVRPYTFSVPDTQDADIKEAVKSKSGRMFGNMVAYSVVVSTWRDPEGNLWEPNTIISLAAKDAMVYRPYEFVVRGVEFLKGKDEHSVLDLVIPGSFSGKIPEALPWDE